MGGITVGVSKCLRVTVKITASDHQFLDVELESLNFRIIGASY